MRSALLVLVVAGLCACSSSSPSPTAPSAPSLSGNWMGVTATSDRFSTFLSGSSAQYSGTGVYSGGDGSACGAFAVTAEQHGDSVTLSGGSGNSCSFTVVGRVVDANRIDGRLSGSLVAAGSQNYVAGADSLTLVRQ